MSPHELLDSAFCVHLTLTLAHFLWQGLVIAVLTMLAAWCLRRKSAQSRYLAYVTALLLMTACLPVTFALVHGTVAEPVAVVQDTPVAGPATPEPLVAPPTEAVQPPSPVVELLGVPSPPPEDKLLPRFEPMPVGAQVSVSAEQPASLLTEPEEEPAGVAPVAGSRWKAVTPYATGVYFAGVLVMLIRLWLALHGGRRLCRRARPVEEPGLLAIVKEQARVLGLRFLPAVAYCERVAVPVVAGVLRPMILLPVSLAAGLTPDQLTAVLTHELTHLRRYDHWVNILQRVVEAVLFFHPAVWYVSRRITVHREHCCDDAVVATGQQCREYAESLIRVAELSRAAQASGTPCLGAVLGAADGKGSRLRTRILRLIDGRGHEEIRLTRTWPAALLLIAALAVASVLAGDRKEPTGEPTESIGEGEESVDEQPLPLARIKARLAAMLPPAMTVSRAEIAEHASGAGLLFHASPKETGKAHPSFALFFWPRSNEKESPYQSTAGAHTFRRIGGSKEFDVYYSGPAGVPRNEIIRAFCTETTSGGADEDLVGRLLTILPPGWEIEAAELLADEVRPPQRLPGQGSSIALVHRPTAGTPSNNAAMTLYVMEKPSSIPPQPSDQPARYLGSGKHGHVYLADGRAESAAHARWSHAKYDIATALKVTESKPEKPTGPDWGRMFAGILRDCSEQRTDCESLAGFCDQVAENTGNKENYAFVYKSNVEIDWDQQPLACKRKDFGRPYYYARVSITPRDLPPDPDASRRIAWDQYAAVRKYSIPWLQAGITITVMSDDEKFPAALNPVLDRQINHVLHETSVATLPDLSKPAAERADTTPADRHDLPPPEAVRDMGALLAALKPRIAKGWELSEVNYGPTFRGDWPVGWGFHVVIYDNEAPLVAGRRAPWTDVHIWVLDRPYDAKGPFLPGGSRPIVELARWRGRRVLVYGGQERWPTRMVDVLTAIRAAGVDKPEGDAAAIRQRFRAFAKLTAALEPKVHLDWHCSEFRYGRDQISNPGVPAGWGCHVRLRQRVEKDARIGADDPYGEAWLWLMDPSLDGRLPEKTDKNFVPDELGRWHGGRTFLWGFARGDGNWHTWQRDLQAALGASDAVSMPMRGSDEDTVDNSSWGVPARGVQVRLRADKAEWNATEAPVVKVDLRNNGSEEFHLVGWMVTNCFAHIDGVTYLGGCSAACPAPGKTVTGIPVKLGNSTTVTNGFSRVPRRSTSGEGDLRWSSGKHTVRISFRMTPRGAPDNTPYVEVFSNPVEIEIVSGEAERPGEPPTPPAPVQPPGAGPVLIPVNTQKTLAAVVGNRFTDWAYPADLLPKKFPGLEHVSGPGDPELPAKAAWRKPVALKHGPSQAEVFVNCYRLAPKQPQPADPNVSRTPFLPLTEPDYRYESAEFHALKAAAAQEGSRNVFAFLDGDVLFKVEVSDGNSERRKALAHSTAETIWKSRHKDDAPSNWSKPAIGLNGRLVVARPRITTSEQFDLSLELRNHHYGGGPWLAVQSGNPFLFNVSVTDANGKTVKPTMQRVDVMYSPKWKVIRPFPDERLTIPVSIRSIDGAKGSHLDTTTDIWKLPPGKYKIAATFTSPKEVRYKGEATPWTGKLELSPIEVEIVAADEDSPDINTHVDNEQRWGTPHLGLRCRLDTEKAQVPMGAKVDFQLHLRYDPSTTLGEEVVNLLNRCGQSRKATLQFTDTKTGKVFRRSPYDPGMPPPGPGMDDVVRLRNDTMGPDRLEIYLLSSKGEQIPPGEYRVVAAYENTGKPEVEVSVGPDGSVIAKPYQGPWKFWKGKIDSAPVILAVTEVEPEEIEIKVNSGLVVKHEKDGTKDTIGWTWSQNAPTRVRIQHRPGYTMGRSYSYQIFLGGKPIGKADERGGLAGSVRDDGGGMRFLEPELVQRVLAGEKLTLRADVEVFETSVPPQHMWSPMAGDFKVLWKGQIEGAL